MEQRERRDQAYIAQFAEHVQVLFPQCFPGREQINAEHACEKYSGRVGRSASAKALDEEAITLAVTAHIRHTETEYDTLISQGYDRFDARQMVQGQIEKILETRK